MSLRRTSLQLAACLVEAARGGHALYVVPTVARAVAAWSALRRAGPSDASVDDSTMTLSVPGAGSVRVSACDGPFLGAPLHSIEVDGVAAPVPVERGRKRT